MVCALCMLAMAFSCVTFEPEYRPVQDMTNDYPITVTAVQEGMTRISADGNTLSWEEADQIQIAAVMQGIEVSDTAALSVLTRFGSIDSDQSKASFTGFVSLLSEPDTCYFTYPVGEALKVDPVAETVTTNYTAQDGSHRPFLYGKTAYDTDGMEVVMKHVGAVLELTVTTPGVAKISFVGNNLESLSPIIINTEDETVTRSNEAVKQLTVNVQKNGKTYLFVPPIALENGFTLICSNEDGSRYFMKSYTDGESDGYDFSGKRGARIPITISGEFNEFEVKASDLRIVHTTNSQGLLTGTKATFKMSKAGTSNKLIEGWGATLTDASGNVVRTYSSTGPITGDECVMDITDNRIFLEGGTYTLTPYYKMYGVTRTFDAANLPKMEIGAPGIVVTIGGATSYDKYTDNNSATDPNTHTNTLLEGLSVSTNVAEDVITKYSAALVGNDGNPVAIVTPSPAVQNSYNVRTYGNKTCSTFQTYTMSVSFKVGHMTVSASKNFHITGLPIDVSFSSGNPTEWTPAWRFIGTVKFDNPRVHFTGDGALRTPAFHLPDKQEIKVKTSVDACLAAVTESRRRVYIKTCSKTENSADFSGSYIVAHYDTSHESNGYEECSDTFTLTDGKPSMLYSKEKPLAYNTSIYKIRIFYSE